MTKSPADELVALGDVVIGHTDFISDVAPRRRQGERRVLQRHLPTLRRGGVTVVCDHLGGDAPYYSVYPATTVAPAEPLKYALQALDQIRMEVEESADAFLIVETSADFATARSEGKIAIVLCLEGAAPIEDDLALLRTLHRLGVRCIGLTHNQRNLVADGIAVGSGGGLTAFGRRAVAEMERLGIAVDVSHLSDDGFWSLAQMAAKPIIASHSNARAINPHPRNLTDDQIRAIADSGGVIGVHALRMLIGDANTATLEQLVDHVEHMATLVGVKHVAIGGDIMPSGWKREAYAELWSASEDLSALEFTYPDDFADLGQTASLVERLLARGFGKDDVRAILGGNWLRVLSAIF